MRLLSLDRQGIQKLIDEMEKECRQIRKSALTFAWHMRGGATYEDILNMSNEEREIINEIIESNLETTKQTKLPFI
jgi:hypothetical protein